VVGRTADVLGGAIVDRQHFLIGQGPYVADAVLGVIGFQRQPAALQPNPELQRIVVLDVDNRCHSHDRAQLVHVEIGARRQEPVRTQGLPVPVKIHQRLVFDGRGLPERDAAAQNNIRRIAKKFVL